LQALHAGVDGNEADDSDMQPPAAATRLFQNEIQQTTASQQSTTTLGNLPNPASSIAGQDMDVDVNEIQQTTAAQQSTTTLENLPNPASGIAGQDMDVDVNSLQSHPPAHIIATVRHEGGHSVRGSTACEVHPTNSNLLWCTKNHHWIHLDHFGELQTCVGCREQEQIWKQRIR
jgi:hypothetical protein